MDLDLNKSPPTSPKAAPCSICLDTVEHARVRSVASLQCGHTFHLDCTGSAFNVKGVMQCPNCRNIEGGNWRFANGVEPSTESSPNFGTGVITFQHLSSFVINGSTVLNSEPTPQSWSSSTLGSSSSAAYRGRPHGTMRGQVQQAGPSATRSSPYPPTTRRMQPVFCQSYLPLQQHKQLRMPSIMTFLKLELQMWKTVTFQIETMPLDMLITCLVGIPSGPFSSSDQAKLVSLIERWLASCYNLIYVASRRW